MTLKELRNFKNLSQNEVAKILNIPIRTYKRYENDKNYEGSIKYNYILETLNKYMPSSNTEKTFIHKSNIVVVGIGYVGLSTAILLSKKSNTTLLDINKEKIDQVNKKISPIKSKAFDVAVKNNNLKATNDIFVYSKADYVIIATPTDLDLNTYKLDTFNVISVIRTVREINRKCLIIIKSTVPVGFTKSILENYNGVIFWPEFLREKSAIDDSFNPSRIIFGADFKSPKINKFKLLVESCVKNNAKAILMKSSNAEAVKLYSNAYLAARIAFFNELDSYAHENGLNSKEIIHGIGLDPRIGSEYNNPSIMFYGYCLPKDAKEVETSIQGIENNQLITSISQSNMARFNYIKNKIIQKACEKSFKDKNKIIIGLYDLETNRSGAGYRMSSSLKLLETLYNEGITTIVYDLNYKDSIKDLTTFCEQADLIVSNKQIKGLRKYKNKIFAIGL